MEGTIVADSPQVLISEAVARIVDAAHPLKIILFGSYARGNSNDQSDLDFLIIMPEVLDRYAEMVKIGRVISALGIPADVLVYSVEDVEARGHLPGTALREALSEGTILYDVAS